MRKADITAIDWKKGEGLVPAIVQDAATLQVLMLGYMNEAALQKTLDSGFVTFYSRSKQRLWQKGETSGNTLALADIGLDCDGDTLLVLARPAGPTCHLGTVSCFGAEDAPGLGWIAQLAAIIKARRETAADGSYTARLFAAGRAKIAQKVGEEGVELALAGAMDAANTAEEAADLIYHMLVLLEATEVPLDDVLEVLRGRHQSATTNRQSDT